MIKKTIQNMFSFFKKLKFFYSSISRKDKIKSRSTKNTYRYKSKRKPYFIANCESLLYTLRYHKELLYLILTISSIALLCLVLKSINVNILTIIYFIILLSSILIFLNDKGTNLDASFFTIIKSYILFNKDLLYSKYYNTRKFYTTYGGLVTINILCIKGLIIGILIYIWLLLINIFMIYNSIISFILTTVFCFILISQITSMHVNTLQGEHHVVISSPSKLSYVYADWVNNWIKGLVIDIFKKYFNMDLFIEENYYLLSMYTYIIMYPFNVLDFIIVYILCGKFDWNLLFYCGSHETSSWCSEDYEIPSMSYTIFPDNNDGKSLVKRLFIIYIVVFSLHLLLTLILCYLVNPKAAFLTYKVVRVARAETKSNLTQYALKNHRVHLGLIPLWKSKYPHYMFRSGMNFYFFTHSPNFNNILVSKFSDLRGEKKDQYINHAYVFNDKKFKNFELKEDLVLQQRAIKFIKKYYFKKHKKDGNSNK